MTAVRHDLTVEQGADYDRPILLTDDDGEIDDLTGVAFALQVRLTPDDPTALLTLTSADGTLLVNPVAGSVQPLIGPAATAALLPGTYVYDLKAREADGRVRRRRSGFVFVSPQVTTAPFGSPPAPGGGSLDFSQPDNSAYAALI